MKFIGSFLSRKSLRLPCEYILLMASLRSSTSVPYLRENYTDRYKIPRYLTEFRSIPKSTRWSGQTAPILIPPPFTTGRSSLPPLRHWQIIGILSSRVRIETQRNISSTRFAFCSMTFLQFCQPATKRQAVFQTEAPIDIHSVRSLWPSSNSSKVRGQSCLRSRDNDRSASNFPPVWHVGQ